MPSRHASPNPLLCTLTALALHIGVIALLAGWFPAITEKDMAAPKFINIDLVDFPESPSRPRAGLVQNPSDQGQSAEPLAETSPASPAPPSDNSDSMQNPPLADNPAPHDPYAQLAADMHQRIQAALIYPEAARRRLAYGTVRLNILLAADGSPVEIRVSTSSGSSILDKAARNLAASVLPLPMPAGLSGNTSIQINVQYNPPQ